MKNKKGFTLIELLAVIAVLAILILVAIPNILNLYRNARENTFVSDVQSIIRSSQQAYVMNTSKNRRCFDSKTNPLDIETKSDLKYKVELSSSGKIISIQVLDNNYQVIKINGTDIKRDDIGNSRSSKSIKVKDRNENQGLTACDGTLIEEGEETKVKYTEDILHGADPVLGQGMIPVMLDNTGKATYAHDYDKWYEYGNKKWANAVILVDNPSNPNYKEGDIISDSDIRAYFVWIPKYKYKLFNMGDYSNYNYVSSLDIVENQAKQIVIEFGTDTVNTSEKDGIECITPMTSGNSGKCKVGEYMTHPAFLSIPSNGFWVGKFETGYNQNNDVKLPITDTSTWNKGGAEKNESYSDTLKTKLIIKPNVYSWRNQTVANFFQIAYNFNRDLDSHMIKNTEWGAVAYLSHSQYGKGTEVRINNNSNHITGYAASEDNAMSSGSDDPTKTFPWNTETGHLASTTGNITGIYDMSGCTSEFVAAYVENGEMTKSGMGTIITNTNYTNYFDKYLSSSTTVTYNNRILGDATGELGDFYRVQPNDIIRDSWYLDYSHFASNLYPWFRRDGRYDDESGSGLFSFNGNAGENNVYSAFHLVLTPTN